MQEKFTAPPIKKSPEKQIESPIEAAPVDETEVVANLHISHNKVLSGETLASEELFTTIRKDLSALECYPIFKEYVAGTVPTFATLQESANRAVKTIDALVTTDRSKGVDEKELAEEIKIQKLLAGRADIIKGSVNAYIQTIIRFHNLKRLSHGGSRDVTEQFVKADESRRRAHEALLKSLQIFTSTAKQAEGEGLLSPGSVKEWTPGMDAKSLIEKAEAIVVFSESTLKNRDYIKDWAMAVDFDTQLQEMLEIQQKPAA